MNMFYASFTIIELTRVDDTVSCITVTIILYLKQAGVHLVMGEETAETEHECPDNWTCI